MEILGAEKRSIVLIPLPLQGHMTPMLQLGSILHTKGFSIIIAHTEFNAPNPLNHPEFVFLPLVDNLAGFDTSFWNLLNVIMAINNNCRAPLVDSLVEMRKDQGSYGQISCIIYDAFMYFGDAVATHLKIPSMVLRTTSAAYTLCYCSILRLQAENYFPLPESQQQESVPELQDFRFKDLPVSVSSKIPDFSLEVFTLDIRSSVGIIWNTIEDLESSLLAQLQQHYKVPIFSVGPFHKMAPASPTSALKEDGGCIAWLDKQAPNSVIYVSLGSLVIIDEKELEETAWALANSNQPFLWVVRPYSVDGSEWVVRLPEGFKDVVGERGLIVKWAPQKKVLAHSAVGGFWTHCGWNSTLESICEEVPMICRPCFGDQLINARYLTHVWKVGIELEHFTDRGVIKRTIRRLMVDDEGKEMRQRVINMKQKLKVSVQKGGSSYRSLNDLTEFIFSSPLQKVTIPLKEEAGKASDQGFRQKCFT